MIQSFNSLEDAFDEMARAEEVAIARMTPAQRALTVPPESGWNRWFVSQFDGTTLYGEVPPAKDLALRARGYLTGVVYSIYEPDGEHGDTHASVVVPVDRYTFELAKAEGWPDTPHDMSLELRRSVRQYAQEAAAV